MLVDELYYGRHRVLRLYQNGKIIWYAGDMLPLSILTTLGSTSNIDGGLATFPIVELFDGTEVQIIPGSIVEGCLMIAPVPLGNAVAEQYVRSWSGQHGTAIQATIAKKFGQEFVGHSQRADLRIANAVMGIRDAHHFVEVYGSATGVVAPALLGTFIGNHFVVASGSATGVVARSELGSFIGDHFVTVSGSATGVVADAVLIGIRGSHQVTVTGRATGVVANAVIVRSRGSHIVTVTERATSVAANAVLIGIRGSHEVTVAGKATGIAANALPLYGEASLNVLGVNRASLIVPDVVNISDKIIEFVHFDTKGRGTTADAVLLGGTVTDVFRVSGKSSATILPSVLASAKYSANLSVKVSGGLAGGIRVVSAAVRDNGCLNFAGDAYLSDYQLPVVEDGNLHIPQAHNIVQVGYKLMLSEQEIEELPNKLVSTPMFATVGIDPVLDANLSDWKLSLAFGDHLYIRQTERGIKNGTDLYVSDWDYPIMANGNLYIRQSGSDIALS